MGVVGRVGRQASAFCLSVVGLLPLERGLGEACGDGHCGSSESYPPPCLDLAEVLILPAEEWVGLHSDPVERRDTDTCTAHQAVCISPVATAAS